MRSAVVRSRQSGVHIRRRRGYILLRRIALPGWCVRGWNSTKRQISSHDVEGLLRPVANEWPRDDGYPLTSRNVAILAVVKKFVRNRHDVLIASVCE
jgi:hypothetical protein